VADDDTGTTGTTGGAKTFTESEVDRIVRDRLARLKSQFSDYDELKVKAGEADRTKSDVDKLTDAVKGLTERAEKAERETIRRDVADKYKLPKTFAAKLSGTTADDLDREARELRDELKLLGVKFDDDKGKGDGAGGGDGKGDGGGQGSTGGDGASGAGQGDGGAGASGGDGSGNGGGARGGRPKEALKSGANQSGGASDGDDPVKAADAILAQRF
jgi:hypothetical protein